MKSNLHPRRAKPIGNKRKFRFEVTFELNTDKGKKLDPSSITHFKECIGNFVRTWSGQEGYFYAYGQGYDSNIIPSYINVKRVD